MKIYIEWILLQVTAPQTRLEWLFLVIISAATAATLGFKWIQEHYKRNRPIDDTPAENQYKELKTKVDQMDTYLKQRTVIIDERFNLVNDRLQETDKIAREGNERSIKNRRFIYKLIDRVLNKSI